MLDVIGRRTHVHGQPSETGYRKITFYNENEQVVLLARPEQTVTVAALLPDISYNTTRL